MKVILILKHFQELLHIHVCYILGMLERYINGPGNSGSGAQATKNIHYHVPIQLASPKKNSRGPAGMAPPNSAANGQRSAAFNPYFYNPLFWYFLQYHQRYHANKPETQVAPMYQLPMGPAMQPHKMMMGQQDKMDKVSRSFGQIDIIQKSFPAKERRNNI